MEINLRQITTELDQLKDREAKLKFELGHTQKHIEQLELQLQAVLTANEVDEMQYGNYSFGWDIRTRKAFDQKLFEQDYPELLNQYKVEKQSKVFKFRMGV